MSANFFTPVPVDLAAIKKLLPPDAYVDPVPKWNKEANRVEVHWSSSEFHSPYSFPHEFTTDMLKARSLPQHVTKAVEAIALPSSDQIVVHETESTEFGEPLPEKKVISVQSVSDNEKPVDAPKKRGKNKTA